MLIKNFFFAFYLLSFNFSSYLLLLLVIVSHNLLSVSLRRKFFFFTLLVIFFSIWGFMFNLDGLMLVMLTTEFTIILLFLMTYIQLYSNYTFIIGNVLTKYIYIIFCILCLRIDSQSAFYAYTSYYNTTRHIVASDFYILYYFLFNKLPILVTFLTLIISFFSFFFIILYFSLKLVKLDVTKSVKSLYFLRKQNLLKQTEFKGNLYAFQN